MSLHQELSMKPPQFKDWAQDWIGNLDTNKRLHEIHRFGRLMRSPAKWKRAWEDGGDTSGIIYLLSAASVIEVKAFCNMIRGSNVRGGKSAERERAVEELVMALLPHHYPSTVLRTSDERPLQKFYSRMLCGCSSSFVEGVLDTQDQSNPLFQLLDMKRLLVAHGDMLKRRLTNYMVREGPPLSKSEVDQCFRAFISREPPSPGSQPYMTASMEFALEMLQARTTLKSTAERWPRDISELEVFASIEKRYTRKSRPANRDTTFLTKLGLQLIGLKRSWELSRQAKTLWRQVLHLWKKHPQKYEDLLSQGTRLAIPTDGPGNALSVICTRWKEDPDLYEHLLVQSLRHGLGGSGKEISEGYLKTIKGIPDPALNSELRWRLLRLYCQHAPERGIDIEVTTDFSCLKFQKWSFGLIDKLERKKAVRFLNGLSKANNGFNFLQSPEGYPSIYDCEEGFLSTGDILRSNFNVELLLVSYQQDDTEIQQRARDEVDQLRKRAATSPKQEDRAHLSKAAAHYAIATGDLEVYAETLFWQQRFLRDPRTVPELLAIKSIRTEEGLNLLSGIPMSPIRDTTLSVVERQLEVANQALKGLSEAKRIAQKEPSYVKSHWDGLEEVYASVYKYRVSRAKEVSLPSHEPKIGLFRIIWKGTEILVHSIGSEFLDRVAHPILELLDQLSGPSVVTASKMLLDSAARYVDKDSRNEGQDKIADSMVTLSHRVVSKLARSNTCVLAQYIIQRAIIEHPEASSWHRQFLTIGYMRRLPAEDAKAMLLSLAAAVGEKLEEQSYVKVGEKESPKSAPPKSSIKVSTVKYLANLLNDADFISPDSAVEVLIELFKSTTHVDVRVAVLSSLLTTLNSVVTESGESWRSNPIVERILRVTESVIPIAGNINERRPVTDIDWAEAEETVGVPATSGYSHMPPLFELLLKVTAGEQFAITRQLQTELLSRLALPTLQYSQEQHHKWFSLFLAKHQAKHKSALNAGNLPRVPIKAYIWEYVLEHLGHILPSETIHEYTQYMLFQLRLPKCIQAFNQALRRDLVLANDASVEHWLHTFDNRMNWELQVRPFLRLIVEPRRNAAPTIDIVNAVINQASVVLDNRMREWHNFVSNLGPVATRPSRSSEEGNSDHGQQDTEKPWNLPHWSETIPPLAKRLIALIEGKRAGRDGAILPSTFPLQLWCLSYPVPHVTREDEHFRRFAVELARALSSLLESDEGEVLMWTTRSDETYAALDRVYKATADRLRLAVHIGDLDLDLNLDDDMDVDADRRSNPTTAAQLVKVSVVLKLIDSVTGHFALRKPGSKHQLTPKIVERGELVERLRVVMNHWADGHGPLVRDMFREWKDRKTTSKYDVWEMDICSWNSAERKEF